MGELVPEGRELGSVLVHDCLVGKEEGGTGCSLEHAELLFSGRVGVGGEDSLQGGLGDVPKLGVLVAKKNGNTCGLTIEGRRRLEGGFIDNLLDPSIGDWKLLSEGVVGAALLSQLEEKISRKRWRHGGLASGNL